MENVIVEKKKNPKLFSMFWNPGEQLNRIRQNPKIWIPLLIVTILYIVGSTIMAFTMKIEDFMVPGMTTQEAEMIAAIATADVIVDALLGIGAVGKPRTPFDMVIGAINKSSAKVFSVDIPSGVSADEADIDVAVKADVTYTVQYPKLSAYLHPAAACYGKLEIIDIGIERAITKVVLKLLKNIKSIIIANNPPCKAVFVKLLMAKLI